MANIALDNFTSAGPQGSSPWTVSYTCNGNFLIVALVTQTVASVTYNGVAMTAASGSPIVHAASGTMSIFYNWRV